MALQSVFRGSLMQSDWQYPLCINLLSGSSQLATTLRFGFILFRTLCLRSYFY